MELIRDNVKVEWEAIGEGLTGDYDPTNPEDVELLRFYVSVLKNGFWEEVENASHCTCFPVSATDEEKLAGLEILMDRFHAVLSRDDEASVKKLGEECSWLGLDSIGAIDSNHTHLQAAASRSTAPQLSTVAPNRSDTDNTTKKLIDAMVEYGMEGCWTDSEIIDELISVGITYDDFKAAGYADFVKEYFKEEQASALAGTGPWAVSVSTENGDVFAIVPGSELADIHLSGIGMTVRHENNNYAVFSGTFAEDHDKLSALLGHYETYPVSAHKIEPVIMSALIEMEIPGFDPDRDSFAFGGYGFVCNGKEVPVDFDGVSYDVIQEGEKIFVSLMTGKTSLATHSLVSDCYEEDYKAVGLRINDITAEFLSKASAVSEFMILADLDGRELDPEEISRIGRFSVRELSFDDGKRSYPVPKAVLAAFNDSLKPAHGKDNQSLSDLVQSAASRAGMTGETAAANHKETTRDR